MRTPPRRRLAAAVAIAVAAATFAAITLSVSPAEASTPVPPSPTVLKTIEPLAAYVPQDSCDPRVKPGTAALAALLAKTYPGTTYFTTYACGTDSSVSEHYEGRAIDWMVPISNKTQTADANAVLSWLFAKDADGNTFSNARRLGVMYIVYDNRIWGAWDGKWHPYKNCANEPGKADDNACHRTHMHISLSWAGANKTTSYWTGKPVATDYGPCVPKALNWAGLHFTPRATACPAHVTLTAPAGASTLYKEIVPWAGARAVYGNSGPAVVAVQRVVGVTADGDFGPLTRTAVEAWQKAHHLTVSGTANQVTWEAFLASAR